MCDGEPFAGYVPTNSWRDAPQLAPGETYGNEPFARYVTPNRWRDMRQRTIGVTGDSFSSLPAWEKYLVDRRVQEAAVNAYSRKPGEGQGQREGVKLRGIGVRAKGQGVTLNIAETGGRLWAHTEITRPVLGHRGQR